MTWQEIMQVLSNANTSEEIDSIREDIASYIPKVRIMFDYDQSNSYHQYDLWQHCVHTVIGLPKGIDDPMLYLAALLHDIGKPDKRIDKPGENAHYYGHPERSYEIVRYVVIPGLEQWGVKLSKRDRQRLLYYVHYHDDRVSLRPKHLGRHLKLATMEEFKRLMHLQVADAKAHVDAPAIRKRIETCSQWTTEYAKEALGVLERMKK